jgi:ATP-binding cassette subfamily F protein 3
VLLDALVEYGGTLIFVSHDRYFVERLATKIVEVGSGTAIVYPGTYSEFLWHKEHPQGQVAQVGPDGRHRRPVPETRAHGGASAAGAARRAPSPGGPPREGQKRRDAKSAAPSALEPSRDDRKRADAEARKRARAEDARRARIGELETRIAETEQAVREIERAMSAPGFYDDRTAAQAMIDRHQTLMWEVGDLMSRWETLQSASDLAAAGDA